MRTTTIVDIDGKTHTNPNLGDLYKLGLTYAPLSPDGAPYSVKTVAVEAYATRESLSAKGLQYYCGNLSGSANDKRIADLVRDLFALLHPLDHDEE